MRYCWLVFMYLFYGSVCFGGQAVKWLDPGNENIVKYSVYRVQNLGPVESMTGPCSHDGIDIVDGITQDLVVYFTIGTNVAAGKNLYIYSNNPSHFSGVFDGSPWDGLDFAANRTQVCVGARGYDNFLFPNNVQEDDYAQIYLWHEKSEELGYESEISSDSWTKSGNLSWYPQNVSCQNATIWREYDTGRIIANAITQSVIGSTICYEYNALPQCILPTPSTCGVQGVSTTYFTTGADTAVVPAPDENYIDPVVNHKHAIGMDYVKYRMSGQSNWHEGIVTVNQGTNQNLHVRVKTKEKE